MPHTTVSVAVSITGARFDDSTVIGTRLPGPGAIYLSQSLKFVKPEKESRALRDWRLAQAGDPELVTSQLARVPNSCVQVPMRA